MFEVAGGHRRHCAETATPVQAAPLPIDVIAPIVFDQPRFLQPGADGVSGRFGPAQSVGTACYRKPIVVFGAFEDHLEPAGLCVVWIVYNDTLAQTVFIFQ